jgi:hypothetical protein
MGNFFAIWGAGLSTVLFIFQVWEKFRDRSRIVTSYGFSSEEIGDSITIANLSGKPITISSYLLYLSRNKRSKSPDYIETGNEGYADNLEISANSTITLSFTEQYHFSNSRKRLRRKNLYLKLYIIGRRQPITKLIYSFK